MAMLKSANYFCTPKAILKIGTLLHQKIKYSREDNATYCAMFQIEDQSQHVNRMLLSSIFSRVIGSNLSKSIYLGQTVQINGDVSFGEEIECKVEILEDLGKNKYRLLTRAYIGSRLIIEGDARILQE